MLCSNWFETDFAKLPANFTVRSVVFLLGSILWNQPSAAQSGFEFGVSPELDTIDIYAFEEPLDCFAFGPTACQATLGGMFPYFYDPYDERFQAIEDARDALNDARTVFGQADIARRLVGSEAYTQVSLHPDVGGGAKAENVRRFLRLFDPITEALGAPSLTGALGVGLNKCNLFVSDCFLAVGIDLRRMKTEASGHLYPPTVEHLSKAGEEIESTFSDFSRMDGQESPKEGDIYVLGGHVGIVVEADRYVYRLGEAPLAVISASSDKNRVIMQAWPPSGWYNSNYIIWRRND